MREQEVFQQCPNAILRRRLAQVDETTQVFPFCLVSERFGENVRTHQVCADVASFDVRHVTSFVQPRNANTVSGLHMTHGEVPPRANDLKHRRVV